MSNPALGQKTHKNYRYKKKTNQGRRTECEMKCQWLTEASAAAPGGGANTGTSAEMKQ